MTALVTTKCVVRPGNEAKEDIRRRTGIPAYLGPSTPQVRSCKQDPIPTLINIAVVSLQRLYVFMYKPS